MSTQQSHDFYGADTFADHLKEHGHTQALQGSITLTSENLSNAAQALSFLTSLLERFLVLRLCFFGGIHSIFQPASVSMKHAGSFSIPSNSLQIAFTIGICLLIQPVVFPQPLGISLLNLAPQSLPHYVPSSPPMTGNLSALGNGTESDPLQFGSVSTSSLVTADELSDDSSIPELVYPLSVLEMRASLFHCPVKSPPVIWHWSYMSIFCCCFYRTTPEPLQAISETDES
ncbi:hypothetical protein C8J56DRAFT_890301 [Mycena floridula]|nr:hypothetical protein C8J56DRAFT_890301 [Mycena floridula]